MIIKRKNGVSFLEFPNLSLHSGILHGIFYRTHGTSSGPFRSLNVSFGVGDDDRNVRQNREIISRCINEKDLVFASQVHGNRIVVFEKDHNWVDVYDELGSHESIDSDFMHNQNDHFTSDVEQKIKTDAMVTNIPQKNLVIQVADCQSILIYDPLQKAVANVHSGWRGSIRNIVGRTIKVMENRFGSLSKDMVVGIGPSLGPCCAEFINYKEEIPKTYWKYKDDNNHFDFWSISRDQICEAGVLMENVNLSRLCTKCNPDQFFSFRGEGITGRFATFIGLK